MSKTKLEKFKFNLQLNSLRILAKIISLLGLTLCSWIASKLGILYWYLQKNRRNLAISNVMDSLEVDEEQAKKIAKASFQENFRSFSEILFTHKFDSKDIVFKNNDKRLHNLSSENWNTLKTVERPVVGVTAHFGAWELLSAILGKTKTFDAPQLVVVRQYPNAATHQFITERREATGATMVGHRLAAPIVLRAFKKNGLVAFLVDHNTKKSSAVKIPFFNQDAYVNMGPALLAVRGKALVFPIFLNRQENQYQYYVYDFLDTTLLEGSMEEKVLAVCKFYTKAVEDHIRSYPEQWFWMHDRWGKKKKG